MQARVIRARQRMLGALKLGPMTCKQLATMLNIQEQTINKYMRDFLEEGRIWRDTARQHAMGRSYYIFHLNEANHG